MGSIVSQLSKNKDDNYYPDIPEDIVKGEILCRLPVKSVIRFRCVCKSWNSLLSGDPDFVKSHLTRYSMNLSNGALIFRCLPLRDYPEFHPLKSRFLQLGGSVNGLVCIYHYDYKVCPIPCIGIWNPAINHYKDIPIPPSSMSTGIPPSRLDISFGIGFDPITNDYKVLYITTYPNRPFVAEVYSCNAGSWGKNSVKSTFLSLGTTFTIPTIVHGRPYWYSKDYTHKYIYVMSFDVQEEVFRFLPGIDLAKKPQDHKMVNLRDSLAFLFYNDNPQSTRDLPRFMYYNYIPKSTNRLVDVYIFNERYGVWTKNYTVGPITMPRSMKLRDCFLNGDLFYSSEYQLKLVSVNSETHAVNNKLDSDMYSFNGSRCILNPAYSYGYTESLVSVEGMNTIHVEEVGNDMLIVGTDL